MDSSVYDIYFQGEALEGFEIGQVKQNMTTLFQANAQTLAALFSGKTVLLKKDLSKDDALKYQTQLKKAGAKIIIKARRIDAPAAAQSPAQPASPPPTARPVAAPATPTRDNTPVAATAARPAPTTAANPPVASDASGAAWSLSAAGSDLLKPDERKSVAAVQVDTSALSVAALSPMPQQTHKNVPPPPDTSSMSIAAVGTTLGTGERERINAQALVPDVDFDVAEVGSRLAEEAISIPLPEPDLSQFSLAAVGSQLGSPSQEPPPKAPDTSHLSVAPQK